MHESTPTIAYLCSGATISTSVQRRPDAFEHDLMLGSLRPAFADKGMELQEVCWDDGSADWTSFDAALIGTTWDYWDRREEFLDALTTISECTRLCNPIEQVRWNIDKRYLVELDRAGAATIPTIWMDLPTALGITKAFDTFGCDNLVLKRQVGASAEGQHRIDRATPIPHLNAPILVQPFQPTILSEGEYSFIFVDGEPSHALNKRASDGDYRVQSTYGGTEFAYTPSAAEWRAAQRVIDLLDEQPLYARVDMIRNEPGHLVLMEIELIEPYLYPEQGPDLGTHMANAVAQRLGLR